MKNLIIKVLILLLVININTRLFAQWETVCFPDSDWCLPTLVSVSFVDFDNGLTVGDKYILKTLNNGTIWDTVSIYDSVYFAKVIYSDPNIAFAVGNHQNGSGVIARSLNSGNTWDTTQTSLWLYSIYFPGDSIGYAVGDSGVILKTTDAGTNWIILNPLGTYKLTTVHFINDTVGFVYGDSIIFKTIDGGASWSNNFFVNIPPWNLVDIFFPSDSIGYIMAHISFDTTKIYKTNDGGNTWNLQFTIPTIWVLTSIFFTNDSTGYICGIFTMLKTIDGGLTWNEQYAAPPGYYDFFDAVMDVFFLNNDTGFAVGNSQFYRTKNGGECFNPVAAYAYSDSLLTINFSDSSINTTNWLWYFGDGDSSTLQNPLHTYDTSGIYNICLIANNLLNGKCGSDTICDPVPVMCPNPVSLFGYTDSLLTVNFSDSSTGVANWLWNFGDGDTSTLQNPLHIYDSAATYIVCLITTNGCGSDTICDSVTVICPNPVSLFSYTDSLLTVNFLDSSTGATSWLWDFGDGTGTSTAKDTTYTYASAGTWWVTLTVTNACGSDTTTQMVTVDVLGINEKWLPYKIKLYPNPNDGNFHLEYSIPKHQHAEFMIFDIMGKRLKTFQLKAGREKLNVFGSTLKSGMYFYQVIIDERVILTDKLMIIKES